MFATVCLCAFVVCSAALGQTTATGEVRGEVIKTSGEPLEGVQITLIPLVENQPAPLSRRMLAVSDNAGRFSVKDLRPGDYVFETGFEGYFLSSSHPLLTKISAGATTNVRLTMNPGAVISGRVRDGAGEPVINANVEIVRLSYRGGYPVLRSAGSQATDDRGEYRLFWAPAGEYYVVASPAAPVRNPRGPHNIETFYPSALNANTATLLTVKPGDEITGIDITMHAGRVAKLSGAITSSVTPPPAPTTEQGVFAVIAQVQNRTADVLLTGRDASLPDREQARHVSVRLNGSSGEFEIPNIPPGAYDLYAIIPDQDAPFALGRTAVEVRDQDVMDVKIDIHSGVAVNGTVSVAGNAVAASALRVLLQPEGTMAKLGLMPPPATVDASGRFTAVGIPEGRYRATVEGQRDDSYVNDVRQNDLSVYDSGFEVGGEPPMPIQIIIKTGAGVVEGTASPGSRVSLVPQVHRENLLRYAETIAGPDGKFTFRGIAPGDYKLFVVENAPDGAFADPKFSARYEDRGRTIRVNPN
jgi:hypothetical protein